MGFSLRRASCRSCCRGLFDDHSVPVVVGELVATSYNLGKDLVVLLPPPTRPWTFLDVRIVGVIQDLNLRSI